MHDLDDVGKRLGLALIAKSREVEGSVTLGRISPVPVQLTPAYRKLEPLETFRGRFAERAIPASTVRPVWVAGRVLVPRAYDPHAPASMLASLAGAGGVHSVEMVITATTAQLYVLGSPQGLGFLVDAWQVAYPEGTIVPATDPFVGLPPVRVLCEAVMPASYDRLVTAPGSLWGQLLRLGSLLGPSDKLVYQVLFERADGWQQNIIAEFGYLLPNDPSLTAPAILAGRIKEHILHFAQALQQFHKGVRT